MMVAANAPAGAAGDPMPHAEHAAKRFWKSGARGYLVSAYAPFSGVLPDLLAACKPDDPDDHHHRRRCGTRRDVLLQIRRTRSQRKM